MSELFRKIDEDFSGSSSWNTQPNCRAFDESYTTGLSVLSCSSFFFTKATALLSRTSILEDAIFHRMNWCKFLKLRQSLQGHRDILPLGLLLLGLRVLDAFFLKEFGDGFDGVNFARLLIS